LSSTAFFARLSATAATALFFAYAFTVASAAMPLKLLDMAWQISVVNAIINNATLPLEGVVLAHLAAYLNPSQARFEAFCQKIRSWALPVTLGFLLIIPLQAYNFSKGLSNYKKSKANFEINVVQGFQKLRNVVLTAPTVGELQKGLTDLKGPSLTAADRSQPLPILRQSLLVALQQAEANAKANNTISNPEQIWSFAKEMFRSIFTSLAFALAFSAAAKLPNWPESLLVRFNKYLESLLKFKFINTGKIVKTFNEKRNADLQFKQSSERQRRHAMEKNRLEQQKKKALKMRLRNAERLKAKEEREKRDI
jgi:hypothetical protein